MGTPRFVGKPQVTTRGAGSFKLITLNALEDAEGQDALLCPVRTLEAYLDRTKQFRSPDKQKLNIPYRRGSVKDMSKQTLSNYIKEPIVLADQEQDSQTLRSLQSKPHSIRHVATSLGALRVISTNDVLQAGTRGRYDLFPPLIGSVLRKVPQFPMKQWSSHRYPP